jgi:hypothetical protein
MEAMAWWLIPITATLLAVVWVSWNSRPRRPADPHDTLAAHRRFTEALTPPVTAQVDPPTAVADERRSA